MRISLPIAVVVIVVAVLGVYGLFYVYATSYIQPQDLKTFEEDLKNIGSTVISENEVNAMESQANQIETGTPITQIPTEQVSTTSQAMKPNQTDKTNIEKLNNKTNTNRAIAIRYDFLLKGEIAKEIRTAYNTKLVDLRKQMLQTQEKAATDFAAGNNTAVAADLKQYVQFAKEYNTLTTQAKASLEKIIQKLKT